MRETFSLAWRVTMRHWDVYRQNFVANISPTLSDPLFIILALGIGLGAYITDIDGRSYLVFLAPGLAISTALWSAFFETSYGFFIRHTYEHVYQAMMTTPIGPREIILGEYLWVGLKGAGMSLGVTIVLLVFRLGDPLFAWTIPLIGFVVALSCGAIGLIASSFVRNINQFQTVYAILINPLFFFSGIFFPLDQVPRVIQVICFASPLYHGVRIGQAALWNDGFGAALLLHGPFLLLLTALLCPIGWMRIFPKLYR